MAAQQRMQAGFSCYINKTELDLILNVGKESFWIKPLMQSTLIVPIDLIRHCFIFLSYSNTIFFSYSPLETGWYSFFRVLKFFFLLIFIIFSYLTTDLALVWLSECLLFFRSLSHTTDHNDFLYSLKSRFSYMWGSTTALLHIAKVHVANDPQDWLRFQYPLCEKWSWTGRISLCCLTEHLDMAPHDRWCDTHFHRVSLGILISLMVYTTFHQNFRRLICPQSEEHFSTCLAWSMCSGPLKLIVLRQISKLNVC